MIGLDTNVLARYFTQDDPVQSARATRFIETQCVPESPGYISMVTLCELVWVLSSGYGYEHADIVRLIRGVLTTSALTVEHPERVWDALRRYEQGKAGFADYLIGFACREAGAMPVYTFDRRAASDPLFAPVP